MKQRKFGRQLVFTLALFNSGAIQVFGQVEFPPPPKAALLDLKLTPNGSVDPPGDRLVGDVLLYPGTDEVEVVVEADAWTETFPPATEVSPIPLGGGLASRPDQPVGPTLKLRPVEATKDAMRSPSGRLQIRTILKRPENGTIAQAVVVVPRAALALVPEDQRIRYTIRGEIDGSEVFFKAANPILRSEKRGPLLVVDSHEPFVAPAPPEAAQPVTPLQDPRRPLPTPQAPSKTLPSAPAMTKYGLQAPSKVAPAPQAPEREFAPQNGEPSEPPPPSPSPIAPGGPLAYAPQAPRTFEALNRRSVLFATNRNVQAASGTPSERFGNEIDMALHYGSCHVNIPVDRHVAGTLELPGWLSWRDPAKHFLIDATLGLELPQYLGIIGGGNSRRDVLVYVHGFNTTFDFAVMRLAQIVHDVQFAGVPVAFSWPSHGSAFRYDWDQDNAERSVVALTTTLLELIKSQAARPAAQRGKVHVLAHSLGNRVTLRALAAIDGQLIGEAKPFGQIVLAAPDVSRAEFEREVPVALRRADRVSLYFCAEDRALMASEVRHPGEPRAGRGVVPVDGLDNIDARKANTSFLAHGYWADVKQLLIDLQMLLNLGLPPIQRNYTLEAAIQPPPQHWRFR